MKVLKGSVQVGDKFHLELDNEKRQLIKRNHSATHLLQSALREVIGKDAHQAGSYQDPERTRFDFTYGEAMTADERYAFWQI